MIKAYRKLAREWHPDNFQDENEKEVAEKRFIEIAAAKEVLTDPGKWCSYGVAHRVESSCWRLFSQLTKPPDSSF